MTQWRKQSILVWDKILIWSVFVSSLSQKVFKNNP